MLEGFHKVVGLDESFFIIKEDASVDAEINFKPLTWKQFKQHRKDIQRILDTLQEFGFTSWDASAPCAIHIHISKAPFTTTHLYKLFKLYYENPNFIIQIARRSPNNYWRFSYDEKDIKDASRSRNSQKDRYELINITDKTLEVRCFKGTLNWDSFKRYVEFVHTSVQFTRETSIRKITVENYFKWLEKHQKEYPLIYGQVKSIL